jgi:F-type H+-transporting ATPase subunit b
MLQLFTQFGVDWKLLLAQVVNFAILIFLLQRFAYKPVIKMLDERRAKIKEGIEASAASKQKLAEAEETKKEILVKAENDALAVVGAAQGTAGKRANEIIAAAQGKGEQVIVAARKRSDEERLKMAEEFGQNAEILLGQGLAKVLAKMNPEERDKLLIAEAVRELKTAK